MGAAGRMATRIRLHLLIETDEQIILYDRAEKASKLHIQSSREILFTEWSDLVAHKHHWSVIERIYLDNCLYIEELKDQLKNQQPVITGPTIVRVATHQPQPQHLGGNREFFLQNYPEFIFLEYFCKKEQMDLEQYRFIFTNRAKQSDRWRATTDLAWVVTEKLMH